VLVRERCGVSYESDQKNQELSQAKSAIILAMRYLLDTNIPVSFFRGKAAIIAKVKEVINKGVGLSMISLGELYHGVNKSNRVKQKIKEVDKFVKTVKLLMVDKAVVWEYGKLMAKLEKKGIKLASMDVLIAATAKANNLIILTGDKQHFPRLKGFGIKVEVIK